jgi:two-component system response regulator FixJ
MALLAAVPNTDRVSLPAQSERHVLLVDHDESLRRALVRSIRLAGFEVDAFPSVDGLLRQGRPERGDCLVLEVGLTGLGGQELHRVLDAAGHAMPTILTTALEPRDVGDSLAALAPLAVLYKPFNKRELLQAIGRAYGSA